MSDSKKKPSSYEIDADDTVDEEFEIVEVNGEKGILTLEFDDLVKEQNKDLSEEELEEFVDTLFLTNETIKPQNRILKIRDYSKRNNLGLKEDELRKFLWDGRKRSKGEVEYFTQDNIIKAPQEKWFWENILMLERTNLINALPKVGKTTLLLDMIG